MVAVSQSSVSNFLLQSLPAPDFALLQPHLEPVTLNLRHSLADAHKPIKYAYFLDSGVASVVAVRTDGTSIEAGIYGREGLGGFALLLGSDQTPHDHFMQIAGTGHQIKKASFTRAVELKSAIAQLARAVRTCVHGSDGANRACQWQRLDRGAFGAVATHVQRPDGRRRD